MPQTYTQGPYVDQWRQEHPDKQFPTPQKYPHMYPQDVAFERRTDYIDLNNVQCTDAKYCPKGLIDYQCQLKHECYLNLINLCLHLSGFLIVIFCLINAFVKVFVQLKNLCKTFAVFGKILGCFGCCLEKVSFGVLGDEILYPEQIKSRGQKKLTYKQQKLKKKLKQMDLEINMDQLDQFKVQKITEIIDDYSIISEQN